VFRSSDLDAYFRGKPWYRPDPRVGVGTLSEDDLAAIRLIQDREHALVARVSGEALRDFELRSRARAWEAVH
jgi:hypothetical protein